MGRCHSALSIGEGGKRFALMGWMALTSGIGLRCLPSVHGGARECGRVGRVAGTRELVINGTHYVAAYAMTETTVRILRVLHGAQGWPEYLLVS